jgi:hypothetical protein
MRIAKQERKSNNFPHESSRALASVLPGSSSNYDSASTDVQVIATEILVAQRL